MSSKKANSKKVVIFDLDDTLQPTQYMYYEIKQEFKKRIVDIFGDKVPEEQILPKLEEVDANNLRVFGLKRTRFPLSLFETYLRFCSETGVKRELWEIKKFYSLGDSVFDKVDPLYENVEDTIITIKKMGYQVYVLTAGDELIQTYKVYKNNLDQLIGKDNIIITPLEKGEALKTNFGKYGLENCVMVGNSIRSDINPAIEIGMNAIYVPEPLEDDKKWNYDRAVKKEGERLYHANNITDVVEVLEQIFGKKADEKLWGNTVANKVAERNTVKKDREILG